MALISKILEDTLTAGNTTVVFTDADIPNSLIRVYTTDSNIYPTSVELSGTSITATFESQSSNLGVALEIVKSGLSVIDNVTTQDDDSALSANQGYVLKGLIDTNSNDIDNIESDLTDKLDKSDFNVSTTTSQFTTKSGGRLSDCIVEFEPVQSGSGTPTPSNVRPISGHTQIEVVLSDENATTISDNIIGLGDTYYGGTLDIVSGELTVDRMILELDGSSDEGWAIDGTGTNNYFYYTNVIFSSLIDTSRDVIFNKVEWTAVFTSNTNQGAYITGRRCRYRYGAEVSLADFLTSLSNEPLQVCYYISTPTTIQLTPTEINTIIGQNNLSTPLSGQSITQATYRELFAWEDVIDVLPISSSTSHNYSTSEQIIGTWINGSNVYEKTIEIQNISYDTSWHNISHNISDLDTVISFSGIITTNTGYFYPIPSYRANTNFGVSIEITSTTINYVNNWLSASDTMYITLRYTKS